MKNEQQYGEGQQAYRDGLPRDACPYTDSKSIPYWNSEAAKQQTWLAGFNAAERANLEISSKY